MTAMNNDEAARRAYWAEQMEQGYAIVQKLIEFPVNECGERFASIPEAAAAANMEMQFSTSKIAGDLDRVYFLRESLVRDVINIGREMNERGWILKIEDGFRSLDPHAGLTGIVGLVRAKFRPAAVAAPRSGLLQSRAPFLIHLAFVVLRFGHPRLCRVRPLDALVPAVHLQPRLRALRQPTEKITDSSHD